MTSRCNKALVFTIIVSLWMAAGNVASMAASDPASNVSSKTISHIYMIGNTYSATGDILAAFPSLKEGAAVDVKSISAQVMLANEGGFRHFDVDLRPAAGNSVDAYVLVKEVSPVKTILTIDNTGDNFTGELRSGLTYINGNLTGRGDAMMLSYTTSPTHLSDVKQLGLFYNATLPKANDNLYFTASYSDTNSGQILSQDLFSMSAAGKGITYGLHYVHNLLRAPTAKESLDIGIDSKQYKNTTLLSVADMPVNIGVDIDALPASIAYQKSEKNGNSLANYSLTYVHNIPGGGLDSTAQYDLYRPGTKATYSLWRASTNIQHMFASGWLTNITVSGQYTDERLIYPEQFGLGGAHSIRGFNERDVSGDRGVQANFELYTPEIAKGQRLLVFYDLGRFSNVDPQPGDLTSGTAASVGLGWRYEDTNGYHFNLDWGYVLNGTVNTPTHSSKVHFLASKIL